MRADPVDVGRDARVDSRFHRTRTLFTVGNDSVDGVRKPLDAGRASDVQPAAAVPLARVAFAGQIPTA